MKKLFVKLLKTTEITQVSLLKRIKGIVKEKPIFDFHEATTEDINKIIKSLNPNKVTGFDHIPLKIIKTAANVIDSNLAYIIYKEEDKGK